MAISQSLQNDADVILSAESDYGSDLDDATLDEVLSQPFAQAFSEPTNTSHAPKNHIEDVEEAVLPERDDAESQAQISSLRLARLRDHVELAISGLGHTSSHLAIIRDSLAEVLVGLEADSTQSPHPARETVRSVEIEYDAANRNTFSSMSLVIHSPPLSLWTEKD